MRRAVGPANRWKAPREQRHIVSLIAVTSEKEMIYKQET
jgi:hypothetical protein